MKVFGTETWKIRLKIVTCPLLSIIFFDTRKFPANRRVPVQSISFRSCDTKSSDKTVMPSPLLCMKIFDKRILLKHQSVLQWNISVQWDKNFSIENVDTPPPSYPNFFDTRNYRNTKGFPPTEIFGTVRQKNFGGKSWYPLPPLWCIKFFTTRNFLIHRSVPQRNFSVLWGKKFWTKSRA